MPCRHKPIYGSYGQQPPGERRGLHHQPGAQGSFELGQGDKPCRYELGSGLVRTKEQSEPKKTCMRAPLRRL